MQSVCYMSKSVAVGTLELILVVRPTTSTPLLAFLDPSENESMAKAEHDQLMVKF